MTNRKTTIVMVAVATTIIISVAAGIYRPAGNDSVEVTVPFKGSMTDCKSVAIQGRYKSISQLLDPARFHDYFIEDRVATWAQNNGMVTGQAHFYKEGRHNPDLRIIVEADVVTGLPYFDRHFKVLFWHYGHINIRFIDPKSNEVVGEAHYTRPFLRMDPDGIDEMILDKIVQKQYGLTDFSAWERREFYKSHIILDLPAGFYGYHDRAFRKEAPEMSVLSLRFHEKKSENRVTPGLTVFFAEMTPDRYSCIKDEARRATDKDIGEYLQWLSEFHEDVSKRDEFAVNGPYTYYIRDYRNQQGRMVRAKAGLNFKLRPEGPLEDDQAIIRMLNSVELR